MFISKRTSCFLFCALSCLFNFSADLILSILWMRSNPMFTALFNLFVCRCPMKCLTIFLFNLGIFSTDIPFHFLHAVIYCGENFPGDLFFVTATILTFFSIAYFSMFSKIKSRLCFMWSGVSLKQTSTLLCLFYLPLLYQVCLALPLFCQRGHTSFSFSFHL